MTIEIEVRRGRSLEENVTLVNNALLAKIRRLKKRSDPWPRARLLAVYADRVVYEVML